MSSQRNTNFVALCFVLITSCCAVRVKIDQKITMKASRAAQEQEAIVNLSLENRNIAGPPKEDCSIYNLADIAENEAKPIEQAILEQVPKVCQGGINQAYADYSVETGQIFVALQLQVSPSESRSFWSRSSSYNICGFVSLKMRPASVHVDLICSHMGYGGVLLMHSEALAARLAKPYTDLDSVPDARPFYEYKGYMHCADPCDPEGCKEQHNVKNGLYIMKKCTSSSAAFQKPVQIHSTGIKARKDITRFFLNGGHRRHKTFTSNDKKYRCCCRVMNLCHLVVEGRDELPLFWRTGFGGCGLYVEDSHSWNFWGEQGRCEIEDGSLNFHDYEELTAMWEKSEEQSQSFNNTSVENSSDAKASYGLDTFEWKPAHYLIYGNF